MGIRKTIATIMAAMFILSLTACAVIPNENSGGVGDTQTDNSGVGDTQTNSNNIAFIGDGNVDEEETSAIEPVKEIGIWDILPEIPVTDASAFKYEYDSELGGMVVTDYLRESPKVRIPDTLEGEPVVRVHFIDCKKELTQLIMPDSVKSFSLSSTIERALQYVNIPNGVTKIRKEAFSYCRSLTSVFISNSVTEIDAWAFKDCTSLTSVNIPDSVSEIGSEAFIHCESLTSVTIPDSVTKIRGGTFYGCTSLTSVTIPDSVTKIWGEAFYGCQSLTNATYKGITYDYTHINDLYEAINNN